MKDDSSRRTDHYIADIYCHMESKEPVTMRSFKHMMKLFHGFNYQEHYEMLLHGQ